MNADGGLPQAIDLIERAYEYLLAYAAQGRQDDAGSEARATLEKMYAALNELPRLVQQELQGDSTVGRYPGHYDMEPFIEALQRDARIARGAVGLALSRASISSLLVDNLNASVHLRALLTDVFLLEQALKARAAE